MDTAGGEEQPRPQQAPPAQEPAKEALLSVAATPSQETDSTMSMDVSFGGPALVSNISLDSLDGARSFAPALGEPSERDSTLPSAGAVLSGRDSPRAKQPNKTATTSNDTNESLGSGSCAGATGAAVERPEAHEEVRGAHEEVRYLHGAHFLHFDSQEEEQGREGQVEVGAETETETETEAKQKELEKEKQEECSKGQEKEVHEQELVEREQKQDSKSREAVEEQESEQRKQEEYNKGQGEVDEGKFEERKHEQDSNAQGVMEFTKNYSDDLMGSVEQQRAASRGGPDLADFELPPYSGSSSSGSEQATAPTKQSPIKQRKSSNSMATQASASSSYAAASNASAAAPDLSAVKNIIMSTYSNFSHVFHWKRPIESGLIFSIGLTLIIALTFFSIISVVAYTALGIILVSGMLRLYKTSMKALNRSSETPVDHIWEKVLNVNVSLSSERLHELVDSSHANLNASLVYFKQVLLVEDKFATTKFFLFVYSLTYIGSWFNGLTLITIIYVSLFSVPLVYENHQDKIDQYLNLATSQISSALSLVTSKLGCCGAGSKKQN